jgi:hypothetical protein
VAVAPPAVREERGDHAGDADAIGDEEPHDWEHATDRHRPHAPPVEEAVRLLDTPVVDAE